MLKPKKARDDSYLRCNVKLKILRTRMVKAVAKCSTQILEDCSDSESEKKQEISEDEVNISDQETIYSEHDSVSEIEQSDDSSASESEEETMKNYFYGKNRYKWSKTPPHPSRIRQHNIYEERAGLKGPALSKNEMSPVETWELLITDDITQAIV
ncbi:unnamed protein product [Parnassius apollo]|uniref:(apollo) hypothetical protein n=1 Tax=Parnassius apollo TaxID=110799 RepID=A0A8S3WUL6_PARAO|nr:unnamed protein product [Parnassius apollo]